MSVGTPFHPAHRRRSTARCSGASGRATSPRASYADAHDIEYNAIREAAALIDVSPLYKYHRLRARRAAAGRPGDHPRRDEARRRRGSSTRPGATSTARSSTTARSTGSTSSGSAGPPPTRSSAGSAMNSAGLDVDDRGRDRGDRRAGAPGPALAGRPRGGDRRVVRATCATSGAARPRSAEVDDRRLAGPATPATSATSCGSRPTARSSVWDALMDGGRRLRASGRRGCSPSTSSGSRPG